MQKVVSILRSCLPAGIRRLAFLQWIKNTLNRQFLGHDDIYNEDYYRKTVEGPIVQSAEIIAQSIIEAYQPVTLMDVGCGTGALLEVFKKRGIRVKGLEYSEAGLALCRSRNLDVAKFDLEKDGLVKSERFKVVVSMEVAEHLPKTIADRYVALLVQLSDVVVFTAAKPGQGGQDHVNEQPSSYWINKFKANGLELDAAKTKAWKQRWESSGTVANWYFDNLLIFHKPQSAK